MRNSVIAKSIFFLFLHPLLINSALSQNIDSQLLINRLEKNLNQREERLMKNIFLQNSFNKFYNHYKSFIGKYKDAKWSIKPIDNDKNQSLLAVNVVSKRKVHDEIYNLNTKQKVLIETYKNKIKGYKVISEESILKSQNSPLIIKLISPEDVLTGEKYEVNIIIEQPLENDLIASGMMILTNKKNENITNKIYEIKLNQSGGLFKYIQAPLKPGNQTISAIITHPKGIYSVTKTIKVGL